MFTWVKLWWYSKRLSSIDCRIRRHAAEVLAQMGDLRAVELLIKALRRRGTRDVAAEALVKLGDPRAVDLQIKALADGDWFCKAAAAEALGLLRDTRAVEPLIKALGDGDVNVRLAAAEALGKLGDPRAVEALIKELGHSGSDVRKIAAEALARLGEVKWKLLIRGDLEDFARLAASDDQRAVEPLIKALGDGARGRETECPPSRRRGGDQPLYLPITPGDQSFALAARPRTHYNHPPRYSKP